MPLRSHKEVLNLKLRSIKVELLKELARSFNIKPKANGAEIIKQVLHKSPDETLIDKFIKERYIALKIKPRIQLITDDDLLKELNKVTTFLWGIEQGQLDQKIQNEYVRRIPRYEELLNMVKAKLHDDVTNYAICTWFNHWTTVMIQEHISIHPKIVPALNERMKGLDIFFDGQPFDLKITYLPKDYDPREATKNPQELAVWLYENQGEQRFGADNRLFIILFDQKNPDESWKLKRNFELVFKKIDDFLSKESISSKDEVVFTFKKKSYTAVTKILIITN